NRGSRDGAQRSSRRSAQDRIDRAQRRVGQNKTARRNTMASATQDTPAGTNGGRDAATIPVENPATGELITTVPLLAPDQVTEMAARARAAQPGWAALGFDGRGRVMKRAQQWMLQNTDRILDVVVSETGKTYEDAQLTDHGYTVSARGFWAKEAGGYLADERVPSWNNPLAIGKKL